MYQALNILRNAAKVGIVRQVLIWGLINMNDWLPINKISETDSLICFHHPQPVYPVHILLVPKEKLYDLTQLKTEDSEFLQDLFATVQSLIADLDLEEKGYRLILNGGEYQDFPQLHFHLTSGEPT
ncbi:MAG: HIT domain-containing protein [Chloroflexota bacterium]|nr:MAG: HIT domain-containing protein [Chloroflexota bacterium]